MKLYPDAAIPLSKIRRRSSKIFTAIELETQRRDIFPGIERCRDGLQGTCWRDSSGKRIGVNAIENGLSSVAREKT
jgi:hypothetical protein